MKELTLDGVLSLIDIQSTEESRRLKTITRIAYYDALYNCYPLPTFGPEPTELDNQATAVSYALTVLNKQLTGNCIINIMTERDEKHQRNTAT